MLYKIGEFSKITGASIRTLRYYDEIDLFKPKEIDIFTNYRYYSEEQINDFEVISTLKKCGFSLEEIKENWNNFDNDIMLKKKEELIKEINDINTKIRKIDYLRSNIKNGKICIGKAKQNVNKNNEGKVKSL